MLKHNSYFDDRVQSVSFERNGLKATVGVISAGNYHFGTESAERLTVISGELIVKRQDSTEWVRYPAGTNFEVATNSAFDVRADESSAYLCEYL